MEQSIEKAIQWLRENGHDAVAENVLPQEGGDVTLNLQGGDDDGDGAVEGGDGLTPKGVILFAEALLRASTDEGEQEESKAFLHEASAVYMQG